MNTIKRILNVPLHPFFFAAYAVLFLLGYNLHEITPASTLRSLLLSLLGAAVVLLVWWALTKDWSRASLLATWCLFSFFAYGHIFNLLNGWKVGSFIIGRHRITVVVWGLLCLGGLILIWWKARHTDQWVAPLNLILLALVLWVGYQVAAYSIQQAVQAGSQNKALLQTLKSKGIHSIDSQLTPPAKADLPDIYYVIMDSYSRADVLKNRFGYDNQPFMDFLKSRGFYLPQCARSNFFTTYLSLPSSLNMEYLQTFGADLIKAGRPTNEFGDYAKWGTVRQTLTGLGYKLVAFKTGFASIDFPNADVFYAPPSTISEASLLYPGMNSYEGMLLGTTLFAPMQERIDAFNLKNPHNQWMDNYTLRQYSLEKLLQVPTSVPGPKFVFAHLMITHPPFVFDAQGNFHYYTQDLDKNIVEGYINAVKYGNIQLEAMVNSILAQPGVKPIIIIQADHGFGYSGDQTQILNAYYLPGGGEQQLYSHITPVNTFRVVFDYYFGGHLGLLPDKSYDLGDNYLYDFIPDIDPDPACR
jgi:hypothetical protein